MRKKVIDIFSPKKPILEIKKAMQKEKGVSLEEAILDKPGAEIRSPLVKKKSLTFKKLKKLLGFGQNPFINFSLALFPVLILGFILSYFTLAKAKIEIWPESELKTFETKLTIDKDKADLLAKVIPGEIFEKEKTVAEVFSASGKVLKEEKAQGTIRVYNEYSASPQVLVATTRFVSAEGKLFRTPTKVTIPGTSFQKGKLVAGEADIKVTADKPGPEYNMGPSTFSIPGFAGTDKYTKIYAKSFQAMAGGFSGEISKITEEDLKKAEDSLTKRAKEENETILKQAIQSSEISSKFKFLENSIQTEMIDKFSSEMAGAESKDFNFQVKVRSKTLIFQKQYFENFIKESLNSQIPEGKKVHEASLKIDLSPEVVNLESGRATLSVKISAKIYSDINTSLLKGAIQGKSSAETKLFLENQPGITKTSVKFWPFWVRAVPDDLKKIELKLNVD